MKKNETNVNEMCLIKCHLLLSNASIFSTHDGYIIDGILFVFDYRNPIGFPENKHNF